MSSRHNRNGSSSASSLPPDKPYGRYRGRRLNKYLVWITQCKCGSKELTFTKSRRTATCAKCGACYAYQEERDLSKEAQQRKEMKARVAREQQEAQEKRAAKERMQE